MTTIPQLGAAGTATGSEQLEASQLSTTVTITATTISAAASDNSYNDSGSGFVTAGFQIGDEVKVSGFTGDTANNINSGVITDLTAGKMTIGGTDGNVIVDDAAGESVTITKWNSARMTAQEIADLGAGATGLQAIPIPATSMTPRATSGAAAGSAETATNKIMVETLDFDASTDEFAQIRWQMPKRWDEGTITAVFVWTAAATGDVVWGVQAVAIANDDPIDAAFGTAQTVTDSVTAANDLMISAATPAMTVAGTPGAAEFVVIQFYRDADNGSDTLAADAKLLGVTLYITTDAGNDA